MSIGPVSSSSGLFNFGNLRIGSREEEAAEVSPVSRAAQFREILAKLRDLRTNLQGLKKSGSLRKAGTAGVLQNQTVRSTSPLSLQTVESATTLGSTEEINATPTSYSPFGPTIAGSSTSLPTLDGVYDGRYGDTTLTFEIQRDATIGSDNHKVEVFDGGSKVDTLIFGFDPPDTELTLKSGLTLSFSAGDVVMNETFTVDVFAATGSVVDINKSFDGTRNDRPNLQYGYNVTAGSFDLNGESISVLASDSIQSVLDRINASAAGVTASFDAGTETIQLEQNTPGSAPTITLANDTSGFLAATKLDTAVPVPGQDDERKLAISSVAALSGISSGSFQIDGTSIVVDTSVDSLNDLIARINSSGVDATASFDAATGKFALFTPNENLTLADGSSGFFSGVNITPKTYYQDLGDSVQTTRFEREERLRSYLKKVARSFGSLFEGEAEGLVAGTVAGAQSRLQQGVVEAFKIVTPNPKPERLRTSLGLRFDFTENAQDVFQIDETKLGKALVGKAEDLDRLLFSGDDNRDGLVDGLLEQVDAIEKEIQRQQVTFGRTGVYVDTRA